MKQTQTKEEYLADGAILRWATHTDAAGYASLAAHAFLIGAEQHSNPNVTHYAHDLTSDRHPLCHSSDVAVVCLDDSIVAAAAVLQQPFVYGGINIPVGRPELVCSHQNVRQRGYVRSIMRKLHDASEARGDVMQVITGIPYYYHQFGYTWAIDYNGFCRVEASDFPPITNMMPRVTIRPFERSEYGLFNTLYTNDIAARALVISTPYPEELFHHSLGVSVSTEGFRAYGIYTEDETCIGFCLLTVRIWDGTLSVMALSYEEPASHYTHSVPVLHAIHAIAQTLPKPVGIQEDYHAVDMLLDGNHPIARVFAALNVTHTIIKPYTWYVRIPDMPKWILHVRHVLEERIAASPLRGYTGSVQITFYRNGIAMEWQDGKLIHVTPRTPAPYGDLPHAGYPYNAFCQQVCGWRSLAELRAWYPDIWATATTAVFLDILFPKSTSQLLWMN